MSNLQSGSPAPAFSVQDQAGKTRTLSEFVGQYLLLYFYPKDETPGCTAEACSFRDYFEELKKHLVVLGVSTDSVESHRLFAAHHRLPFLLLSDPEKNMIRTYGVNGILGTKRFSFLIDPDGIIAKVYDRVNPTTHPQEVLTDLLNLQKASV